MRVKKIDKLCISLLIIIFIISMLGLFFVERKNDTKVEDYLIKQSKISDKTYDFEIDNINLSNGDILIQMWFLDNPKPTVINEYILLEDVNTKKTIMIPTAVSQREDIVEAYGDNAYAYCGIEARVSSKYIDANSDYKIYLLDKNDDQEKIIDLGTTVKGWNKNDK